MNKTVIKVFEYICFWCLHDVTLEESLQFCVKKIIARWSNLDNIKRGVCFRDELSIDNDSGNSANSKVLSDVVIEDKVMMGKVFDVKFKS